MFNSPAIGSSIFLGIRYRQRGQCLPSLSVQTFRNRTFIQAVLTTLSLSIVVIGHEDLSDYLVTYDHWSNDTVRVSVLLPNDSLYLGAIPRVGPAIELAIQKIQDRGTLPEWKWQVRYRNTKCSTSDGPMQAFRAFTEQRLHVFFGPYCDYVIAPIARLLKFWNVPMLTAGALARDYGFDKSTFDKEFYLLTRTGLSFNGVTSFLLAVFSRFEWLNVLITYEELARPQIAREDYCVLLTKALVAEFRLLGNFTFHPYKLKSNISAAESRNVLKKEVGTKYGDFLNDLTWRSLHVALEQAARRYVSLIYISIYDKEKTARVVGEESVVFVGIFKLINEAIKDIGKDRCSVLWKEILLKRYKSHIIVKVEKQGTK